MVTLRTTCFNTEELPTLPCRSSVSVSQETAITSLATLTYSVCNEHARCSLWAANWDFRTSGFRGWVMLLLACSLMQRALWTFRDNLSGPIGYPETSVKNYNCTLRNSPEWGSSRLDIVHPRKHNTIMNEFRTTGYELGTGHTQARHGTCWQDSSTCACMCLRARKHTRTHTHSKQNGALQRARLHAQCNWSESKREI